MLTSVLIERYFINAYGATMGGLNVRQYNLMLEGGTVVEKGFDKINFVQAIEYKTGNNYILGAIQ